MKTPVVLIACNREASVRGTPAHFVRDTYIKAVTEVANAQPLLLPATGAAFDLAANREFIAGILLTGSPSHVSPACYGAAQEFPDEDLDKARDRTALPLIEQAIAQDVPLLAICRGFQELNVSRGGTLHQFVHKLPGKLDHRPKKELTVMENYLARAHDVEFRKGGLFEKWAMPPRFGVNSVHTQGVDKLGDGLHVEAIAPDGLIEAVSLPGKKFIFGTQWHPEGDCFINPANRKVFEEFGKALRE
jgi:putative glutamine amidotransferase